MRQSSSTLMRVSVLIIALMVTAAAFQKANMARAQDDVPVDAETVQSLMTEPPPPPPKDANKPSGIDLLSLITRGGAFMIPIGMMSVLVVTLAAERLLSLRRKRVIPRAFVSQLEELTEPIDRFNPAAALALCRQYPSPAATAVEAMLMRTGQPLAEAERAAVESIQREADDYAAPIRWLSLASSATPLMGLLGTVWGMILAFHESTLLTPDRSRSEQLSEGIYTALITTLAGLIVAIPAAIFSQYLENRLSKLFHRIERLTFDLAPALQRFQGRARLDADGTLRAMTPTGAAPPAGPASTASGHSVVQTSTGVPSVPSASPPVMGGSGASIGSAGLATSVASQAASKGGRLTR